MMTSSKGNIFRVTVPLCGEFTGPGEFPAQRPVTRSFGVFFDLHLNKRLSKQPPGWWFETSLWSLWRHCNVLYICRKHLVTNFQGIQHWLPFFFNLIWPSTRFTTLQEYRQSEHNECVKYGNHDSDTNSSGNEHTHVGHYQQFYRSMLVPDKCDKMSIRCNSKASIKAPI